jgi:flagellar basal body-associated protein FliL
MDNNNPNNQIPSIPESEMKLPEEQYQETNMEPAAKKSPWTVVLLVLIVLLLGAMAAVIVWGEELVNLILPPEQIEMPAPIEERVVTEEENVEDIETELEDMDFTDMEAELNEIEAEIEAEASATTTP